VRYASSAGEAARPTAETVGRDPATTLRAHLTGGASLAEAMPQQTSWTQLATTFWESQTLAAAVELGLFTRVARTGSMTVDEAMLDLGLERRPAALLLSVCASLDLLLRTSTGYTNSPLAEAHLVADRRDYLGDLITTSFQSGAPTSPCVAGAGRLWDAIHSLSTLTARQLAQVHDFGSSVRILDVGGGTGASLIELCRSRWHLSGTVYDMRQACRIAQRRTEEAGLDEVIVTIEGDYRTQRLPQGHDVILLSQVLHDLDAGRGRALLRRCRAALSDDGVLLVCEQFAKAQEQFAKAQEPAAGASVAHCRSWLADAGFAVETVSSLTAPFANTVIVASVA
jgi:3-hydroxy-5-methyl-1-naphthoate 3-O-methyltransferase